MDDHNDCKNSRAPELEDLVNLCRRLNEQGARYVLIGGFAPTTSRLRRPEGEFKIFE